MRTLGHVFAVAALMLVASPSETLAKPNVLFIAIDDMNDWAGYLKGHPQVKTPNLDRFAGASMVFRNTYCAAPICNPSRVAVLSGMSPVSTGIYLNGKAHDWKKSKPLETATSLPELFHDSGYETFWAGKIFHTRPPEDRLDKMWDDRSSADGGYGPQSKSDYVTKEASRFKNFDWDEWESADTDFADVNNTAKVVSFLQESHEKPFFAAMGFYRPHDPWTAPKRYFDPFPIDDIELPATIENDLDDVPVAAIKIRDSAGNHDEIVKIGQDKPLVRAYLASIHFMDDMLGQVLDALESSPYADNTIVVLWSDHGFNHGEKDIWGKSALWEQTTRCLLGIRMPDGLGEGQSSRTPVNLLDIYPTLVELCELPAPRQKLDGTSVVELMRQPERQRKFPSLTWFGADNVSVRSENFRMIRYFDGSLELYDHRTDSKEWTNLAGDPDYKPVIEKLLEVIPKQRALSVGNNPKGQGR